jgi:hypothetical protein
MEERKVPVNRREKGKRQKSYFCGILHCMAILAFKDLVGHWIEICVFCRNMDIDHGFV